MVEKYTLLEAKVNGTVKKQQWGEIDIPVEVTKVEFVGFEPTISQCAYYMLISKEEAKKHVDELEAELVCDEIIYYEELPFELHEGDTIRAYMNRQYIATANKIEKIEEPVKK